MTCRLWLHNGRAARAGRDFPEPLSQSIQQTVRSGRTPATGRELMRVPRPQARVPGATHGNTRWGIDAAVTPGMVWLQFPQWESLRAAGAVVLLAAATGLPAG